MKIFPRSISIVEDKMVDFNPRFGYVEAGTTSTVALKDFDQNWQVACKRNGEVKKVIDLVNSSAEERTSTVAKAESARQQRNAGKHLVLGSGLPRVRSTDSADAFSETSSVSVSQSIASAAFYSPSVTANSSPTSAARSTGDFADQSAVASPGEGYDRQQHRHEQVVPGSSLDFDSFSLAESALEESMDQPPSSPHPEPRTDPSKTELLPGSASMQSGTDADEADPKGVPTVGQADLPPSQSEAAVLAELLQRLSQSPNTATLLAGLLRVAPPPPPPYVPAQQQQRSEDSRKQPTATHHSRDAVSRAEQVRRFLEAEDESFPPVRQLLDEEPQSGEPAQKDLVAMYSRLTPLGSSARFRAGQALGDRDEGGDDQSEGELRVGGAVLLEVSGSCVTNSELARIVEQRLEQAVEDRQRVTAIEVTGCALTSLKASLGGLFADTGDDGAVSKQLHALRAAFLEDGLRHLNLNHCALTDLDTSVNRFRHLRSLNLSGNNIRSICAPLQLPLLRSLDLSHNLLTSLDYLQQLSSLSTLVVCGNKICSLRLSVNMLVSLSKSLVSLDLTGNPVCEDRHYAQEVVQVLPRLRFFDSCDLQSMSSAYSYSFSTGGPSSRGSGATQRPGRQATPQRGRLPNLPEEVRGGVRDAQGGEGRSTHAHRRKDFERRLLSALVLRRRHGRVADQHLQKTSSPSPHKSVVSGSARSTHSSQASQQVDLGSQRGDQGDWGEEDSAIQETESFIQHLSSGFTNKTRATARPTISRYAERGGDSGDDEVGPTAMEAEAATGPGSAELRELGVTELSQYWPVGHHTGASLGGKMKDVPPIAQDSSLLDSTEALRLRRRLHGVADRSERFPQHPQSASHSAMYSSLTLGEAGSRGDIGAPHSPEASASRGYFSESEVTRRQPRHALSARKTAAMVALSEEQFLAMQEDERYGAWHPRYRVPKPVFGFSKPFAHRRRPSLKDHAPLFDSTVQRLRESFRKAPARGTFARAGKGLPGGWYPMDFGEVEAARRHGYFDQTIGEVTRDSYQDTAKGSAGKAVNSSNSSMHPSGTGSAALDRSSRLGGASGVADFLQEALVSPRGSVSLSPQKPGRRQSWGPHMSRFDPASSVVQLSDDFSGFRKWHPHLFDGALEGESQQQGQFTGSTADNALWPSDARAEALSGSLVQPSHPPPVNTPPAPVAQVPAGVYSAPRHHDNEVPGVAPATQEPDARNLSTRAAAPPPLPAEADRRAVSLLDIDCRDSADLQRTNSTSPLEQGPDSQDSQDSGAEENMRMFDAIPDFPVETLPVSSPSPEAPPSEHAGEGDARAELLMSPALQQLSAISQRIDAEEAELANYLQWLDSQQRNEGDGVPAAEQLQQQHLQQPYQPPNSYAPNRAQEPHGRQQAHHSNSGIPRYAANRPSLLSPPPAEQAPQDAGRVFSPREAAMRAEQPDLTHTNGTARATKSAFHTRPAFGLYSAHK